MVLWKKLWYHGKNYGTISKTMELRFTKETNMVHVDYQKLYKTLIYNGKNYGNIPKQMKILTNIYIVALEL